ncbi:MAG: glycosyltransferase family 39 protein [Candidatus Thermoplasmatota archaeon]|nr:glycosyltransferase family 39 protein [Candidatus Thermoplasmatota archaeon]
MKLLENLTTDKRKVLIAVVLILAAAAFLRFYNINWSFSNNGVDEGIMLERARMVSQGYGLYTELPCDQAPLVFLIGSVFDGDVVVLRALTAALSLVAIAACMLASKKQHGNVAMLVTGVLLAIDFALLRESRLFSLDGISTSFLAISLPLFLHYLRKGSRAALILAGLLVGLSTASKLFGGVALLGMLLFMLLQFWQGDKENKKATRTIIDLVILLGAAAVPLAVLILALGPSDMLNGMLFDQGHREFDLAMKLSIPVFFGLNLAYALPLVYARRVWSHSKEARFLLILTVVLLADFVLQPLVFLHHMVLMSPGLAILSGMFIAHGYETKKGLFIEKIEMIDRKKRTYESKAVMAVLLVGILVSAGLASYGLAAQEKPGQLAYGEKIAAWTTPNDWIISGDPLITSYAKRLTPPSMVNVGTRVYPELTGDDIYAAVFEYRPAVFLFSYRFVENDLFHVAIFLEGLGYSKVSSDFMGVWSESAFGAFENVDAPMVFVRDDIIEAFNLPTEGWSI